MVGRDCELAGERTWWQAWLARGDGCDDRIFDEVPHVMGVDERGGGCTVVLGNEQSHAEAAQHLLRGRAQALVIVGYVDELGGVGQFFDGDARALGDPETARVRCLACQGPGGRAGATSGHPEFLQQWL
jgi:hypothetical protein